MEKQDSYKVSIPSLITPSGTKKLWGVTFRNGVATGVTNTLALSSFRSMGYTVEKEKPQPDKKAKAPEPTGDVATDVAAAIEGVKVTKAPKVPKAKSADKPAEDPGEEIPLPEE